jgi:hypothetical protein
VDVPEQQRRRYRRELYGVQGDYFTTTRRAFASGIFGRPIQIDRPARPRLPGTS